MLAVNGIYIIWQFKLLTKEQNEHNKLEKVQGNKQTKHIRIYLKMDARKLKVNISDYCD